MITIQCEDGQELEFANDSALVTDSDVLKDTTETFVAVPCTLNALFCAKTFYDAQESGEDRFCTSWRVIDFSKPCTRIPGSNYAFEATRITQPWDFRKSFFCQAQYQAIIYSVSEDDFTSLRELSQNLQLNLLSYLCDLRVDADSVGVKISGPDNIVVELDKFTTWKCKHFAENIFEDEDEEDYKEETVIVSFKKRFADAIKIYVSVFKANPFPEAELIPPFDTLSEYGVPQEIEDLFDQLYNQADLGEFGHGEEKEMEIESTTETDKWDPYRLRCAALHLDYPHLLNICRLYLATKMQQLHPCYWTDVLGIPLGDDVNCRRALALYIRAVDKRPAEEDISDEEAEKRREWEEAHKYRV